ncbi:MAG: hypothetical protein K9N06_03210 [Candidatus Cloacimonetes bacterium]|nr:hypothetical protein [Candidatus Cloacimonadota bacterium]
MKNTLLIICCLLLLVPAYPVSSQQNKNNIAFLDELDQNIISTIDLLSVFNNIAKNMDASIKDADKFSKYLLDLTMECSAMRSIIAQTQDCNDKEREIAIRLVFDYIKPHEIELNDLVNGGVDEINRKYLTDLEITYQEKINKLRNSLLEEEKIIQQKHMITSRYIALHNRHFIYHLILDFIENQQYLSRTNRQYLIDLIKAVEEGISQSLK